jgi:DNA-binding SARP family transcriptional activator
MADIRVSLMGRTAVEVDGREVRLTPLTTAVLIRLVIAEGRPVTVEELYRDVWRDDVSRIGREERVGVQKRILELRRVLDPGRPGETSRVLRTERGRISAYRLVLGGEQVDVRRFHDLVARAGRATPVTAVDLLTQALALWRGRPLFDVEDRPFAAEPIRRLRALHESALRELMHAYRDIGRPDRALDTGEALLAELPGDTELAERVGELRRQVRARFGGVLRRDLTDPPTAVVVTAGDLFAQDDAHLVVGFTDTFDTSTDQDIVISSASVQGQLTRRLYGGDRERLDRALRGALRHITPAGTETRAAKRRGKLTRYPLGSVAVLHHTGRCVFAVAYSRMGNDLVAGSSRTALRLGLEGLWGAVHRHGQRKPVAVPLIGAGLARVDPMRREELLTMVIESFVENSRRRLLAPELRIVVRPEELAEIEISEVADFLQKR